MVENSYFAPNDWKNTVNNTKGWIVEFRMKFEPLSNYAERRSAFEIEIYDKQYYTRISFDESSIIFGAPGIPADSPQRYYMDTTDTFHVYRIIEQRNILKVFVDEKLVIETLNIFGPRINSPDLQIHFFGKSYWDYFSYDTNPNLNLTSPTL